MSVEIKMPQMGESITEGTVVRWFVGPGDRIERDAPLLEISTDKVDTEVPAPQAGWIVKILVEEGDTVPVDTPVCILTETASESVPAPDPQTSSGPESASAPPAGASPAGPPAGPPAAPPAEAPRPGRLSPAVRRLVSEHGVDVSLIRGTGEGGRVTRNDVLSFLESSPSRSTSDSSSPSAASSAPASPSEDRVEPMSVMRRKIAEHMVESRRTSAHVSTVHEADFTDVRRLRDECRPGFESRGVKLTYLPFLAQAVARGLVEHPTLNASIEGDNVRYRASVQLGIAVAIESGLIVPVLRDVEEASVFEIARGIHDLADRARRKTLRPEEVHGGSFTLTNPGGFGTLIGMPIINQPQVAILCFGAVQKRAVVLDESDAIAVRSMAYLSLTFDHRLIDGAEADLFTQGVCRRIETSDFRIE